MGRWLSLHEIITMRTLHLSNDELYQMVKLYDLLRDTDMIDELPVEIETVFDRLQSMGGNQ